MHRSSILIAAAVMAAAIAVPATAQSPPGTYTIKFKELNKGSSFRFLDNPPRARSRSQPTVSAGDEFIISTPIASDTGVRLGHLRATCTITADSKNPDRAASVCTGGFSLRYGTLFAMVAQSGNTNSTSGAIVGGTGVYAGARGTFVSHNTKSGSNDTVTLLTR